MLNGGNWVVVSTWALDYEILIRILPCNFAIFKTIKQWDNWSFAHVKGNHKHPWANKTIKICNILYNTAKSTLPESLEL